MLLVGNGFSLCFAPVNARATAGITDEEQGRPQGWSPPACGPGADAIVPSGS